MQRPLRHLLIGLLLAIAALAAGAGWLLGSSSGAAIMLGLVPGLQVEKVHGRLYDGLRLEGLHWRGRRTSLDITRLTFEWAPGALLRTTLRIANLEGDGLRITLPLDNDQATGTTAPPPLTLPLDLQLDQLVMKDIQVRRAENLLFSGDLRAIAHGHDNVLELKKLEIREDRFDLRLDGRLPLDDGDGLALSLTWSSTTPKLGDLQGTAQLSGRLRDLRIDHRLTAPWSVRTQGSMRPFDELRVDLDGSWDTLTWPADRQPEFTSPTGEFHLQGTPGDYELSMQGTLVSPGLPLQAFHLSGKGGHQSLQLHKLTVSGPGGRLEGKGQLAWTPHPSWSLQVTTQGFDPAPFAPDWPGAIDLKGTLAGEMATQGLTQTLALQALSGQLRGYPVSGQGRLRQRGKELEFQDVALHSGSNTLALAGKLGNILDLRFGLEIDQPEAVLPELAGHLQASGRLQGTRDDPQLEMTAQGNDLAWLDYRLAQLDLKAHWGLGDDQGRIQLSGEGLEFAKERFSEVQAHFVGETSQHNIQLMLAGDTLSGQADATGGWSSGRWHGQIKALSLKQVDVGEWSLTQPTNITLASNALQLEPTCLSHGQSRVCGNVELTPERRISAKASLVDVEVSQWAYLLGEEVQGSGTISAQLKVTGSFDTPSIDARLTPMRGTLQWPIVVGEPLVVAYQVEEMTYSQKGDLGALTFRADLDRRGRLAGRFTRQGEKLGGGFSLASEDPAWLGEWLTQVTEIRGRLDIDGKIGGTLRAPTLSLQGGITGGHLIVADSGIEVDEIELRFTPDRGDRFSLQGVARSGGGKLAINGWVNTALPSWSLQLSGEAFQVARLPEAQIWASPDLTFSQQAGMRRLAGKVLVPRAQLDLQDLSEGAVTESPDVIVVDPRGRPLPAGSQTGLAYLDGLSLDLTLQLGDDVHLKGHGIRTRLIGRLQLTLQEGQTLAQGRIDLVEGHYRAYGQDLSLERGTLIFNGPLDNPALDLVASRESIDGTVKALLKVSGKLKDPKLAVSSDPALPASEALSYLITGASLTKADKEEGVAVYSAALSLGLTQSEPQLTEMRDRLGLDEFQIKGGSRLEESALSLGKQLQDNLYLGYTVGLFDSTGALLLRLKLGEHMEVETRSGERQSVDIFYRTEHD